MRFAAICLCFLSASVLAWDPSPGLGFEHWPTERTHQVGEDYWMGWEVEDEQPARPAEERLVTLALAVNTLGYVAFGLTHNGGMKGADMVVVRGANGDFTATSMSSVDYVTPTADAVQPWKLLEWNQMNGESYFVVQRTAGGCTDSFVNLEFTDLEQRFIFSFGRTQDFVYHSVTQRYSIQLNVFQEDPIVGPPDLPYFDTIMPGYEVPLEVDSFICANMTFPISDSRFHIVAIEPLINHKTAHHFVGWSCPNGVTIPDDATAEGAWECLTMAQPDCEILPVIWTQGQPLYTLAPHVGIPLGQGGAVNIILQMHNNNPTFETGIRDTSGLRLYYTEDLRENDVGIFILGNNARPEAIVLPPQQPSVSVTSDCPSKCTQYQEPFTAFSFHWHMHQTGKRMDFRQIRDGREILHLSMDHWDYNWQGYYENKEFQVLPGDQFSTECIFDTTNRTEVTYGGDGTQEEMCFFYISVYPITNGFGCLGVEMPRAGQPYVTMCGNGEIAEHFAEPFIPLPEKEFCPL